MHEAKCIDVWGGIYWDTNQKFLISLNARPSDGNLFANNNGDGVETAKNKFILVMAGLQSTVDCGGSLLMRQSTPLQFAASASPGLFRQSFICERKSKAKTWRRHKVVLGFDFFLDRTHWSFYQRPTLRNTLNRRKSSRELRILHLWSEMSWRRVAFLGFHTCFSTQVRLPPHFNHEIENVSKRSAARGWLTQDENKEKLQSFSAVFRSLLEVVKLFLCQKVQMLLSSYDMLSKRVKSLSNFCLKLHLEKCKKKPISVCCCCRCMFVQLKKSSTTRMWDIIRDFQDKLRVAWAS